MKIFLISPVRAITDEERTAIALYVDTLEKAGHKVHWPGRGDTNQNDHVGLRICTDNLRAIEEADELHVWYNPSSSGSLFDIGMGFALRKKFVLINCDMVQPTDGRKSFNNVLLALTQNDIT